jgi:VanZ like family
MPMHWVMSHLARAWANWRPGIIVALIAVPVVIVAAVWLTRRRRRAGWPAAWAARSAWSEIIMIVGTVPSLVLTLTPTSGVNGVNLVPFRDLAILVHIGWEHAAVQIVGNLLLLAPLGFGMPIRWRVGPFAVLVAGACASAVIESLQWVLHLGRFSSVDDVLVNAVGAAIAAMVAYPWWRSRGSAANTDVSDAAAPAHHSVASARSVP